MSDLSRLSLNQITTRSWSLPEAVAACADAGLGGIGLWRDKVADVGVDTAAKLVRDAGLTVTSLCRAGFFAGGPDEVPDRAGDNRAAVEEAAALGTDVLVLVCGGLPAGSKDLAAARRAVFEGIADLAPYAARHGVRLAIEPLHPAFCADRSVVVTLRQALDLAEHFPPEQVGVCLDAYHLWWDPEVLPQIARARGRILSWQICDWLDPQPGSVLVGRGLPGQGVADLRTLHAAITDAGYDGLVDVEVFNDAVWAAPPEETLAAVIAGYRDLMA